jgi:hypothetical protein
MANLMLVSAACRKRSDDEEGARGRAFLALEEDGSESVEVFCSECAKEEFDA